MKPSQLIYRVWDTKHLYYVNRLQEPNGHQQNSLSCGIYGLHDNSAEIELYTGYQDSADGKIFDGDIISVLPSQASEPLEYLVQMIEGAWRLCDQNSKQTYPMHQILYDANTISVLITGNIHEQELINKKGIER